MLIFAAVRLFLNFTLDAGMIACVGAWAFAAIAYGLLDYYVRGFGYTIIQHRWGRHHE